MAPLTSLCLLAVAAIAQADYLRPRQDGCPTTTTDLPDYLNTTPGPYAGYTATGSAPFVAETNLAPFGKKGVGINDPLQTSMPIKGAPSYDSIFSLMGKLTPYSPSPGFGADEYPLPPGSNITQVHVIHRHGARYPTRNDGPEQFGKKLAKLVADGVRFEGELSFINNWNYELGDEMLVARGRQELFDSGILHWYNYGKLYDPSTKIIARTTTMYRMLQSAENFMAGFFGLNWRDNVTIEAVIEAAGFNGSASAYGQCPNSVKPLSNTASDAVDRWMNIYLHGATRRFQQHVTGYNFTVEDLYNMQQLCSYETVAFGFSRFCQLFTYDEWKGREYIEDLQWYGDHSFGSPTARAVGIGQVIETLARMEGHVVDAAAGSSSSVNMTLDGNEETFPTNQTLYFDFSHDTQMMSVLTAFGLRQFAQYLPPTGPPGHHQQLVASHITPFAARFAIEVIRAPRPVLARRPQHGASQAGAYNISAPARETRYVHFLVNQRTVPLGESFADCGDRDDGWCEYETFLKWQKENVKRARFEYSCFGNYSEVPYGVVMDGVPVH